MDTSAKLDMALDDVAAASGGGRRGVVRGGRPPKGGGGGREAAPREDGFNPYRNTAGRTHLAGASLQEIAAAPDEERCAPPGRACAAQQASRAPDARSVLKVGATTSAKTIAVRGSGECATRARAPMRYSALAERAACRAPSRT